MATIAFFKDGLGIYGDYDVDYDKGILYFTERGTQKVIARKFSGLLAIHETGATEEEIRRQFPPMVQ